MPISYLAPISLFCMIMMSSDYYLLTLPSATKLRYTLLSNSKKILNMSSENDSIPIYYIMQLDYADNWF